jgi:DNA-binding transcriptional MerR regulator
MTRLSHPLWTIDELGAAVALTLAEDYEGPPNNRVREVPDQRTIRYYTTIGLLDRPAEMRGRTALYGRRHLAQLVAIKRLQARGLSLAEVQHRLLGITDAALNRLAKLPNLEGLSSVEPAAKEQADRRANAFWSAAPVAPTLETTEAIPDDAMIGYDAAPGERVAEPPAVLPLQGVPLGDEVILLLSTSRIIDEDDLPGIHAAAAPLLKLLQARRLLRPRQERGTS